MGLDMYITANRFMWTHKPEESVLAQQIRDIIGIDAPIESVKIKAGYWRKANQIHHWFVDNVQAGDDNCAEYAVYVEELEKLQKICSELLDCYELTGTENEPISKEFSDLCKKNLPPQEGFFFGTYEIDQYYVQDLQETVQIIDRVKKLAADDPGLDFYYQSSW